MKKIILLLITLFMAGCSSNNLHDLEIEQSTWVFTEMLNKNGDVIYVSKENATLYPDLETISITIEASNEKIKMTQNDTVTEGHYRLETIGSSAIYYDVEIDTYDYKCIISYKKESKQKEKIMVLQNDKITLYLEGK